MNSCERSPNRAAAVLPCLIFAGLIAFAGLMASLGLAADLEKTDLSKALVTTPMTEEEQIIHVLNRLAFGPTSEEVARVRQIGLSQYISEQLAPETVDDADVARRLDRLETIDLSSRELAERYGNRNQQPRTRQRPSPESGASESTEMAEQDRKAAMAARRKQRAGLRKVGLELQQAKIIRATYSKRQLQEVMTDFWFNHFNVFIGKGADRILTTEYEREVIRPHALGKFHELLAATAKSPAMLFYLDNWMSVDPSRANRRRRRPGRAESMQQGENASRNVQRARRVRGLNENYARELMELHTLGVDGGYTQKDVTEVARCFTGWTIRNPRQGGSFRFFDRLHDQDEKVVLGRTIEAGGGIGDGEFVLRMLSTHPSTARFVSTKLCRRFVSDDPPEALVERVAETFTRTDGDIRAVLASIFTAPEFFSQEAHKAKVKKPFELLVSALRATDAETTASQKVLLSLRRMGEALYGCEPPTGYADTADAWLNTGALLERMNLMLSLAQGRIRGTRVKWGPAGDQTTHELIGSLSQQILFTTPSASWMDTIAESAEIDSVGSSRRVATIAGLILGAPDFQRR